MSSVCPSHCAFNSGLKKKEKQNQMVHDMLTVNSQELNKVVPSTIHKSVLNIATILDTLAMVPGVYYAVLD